MHVLVLNCSSSTLKFQVIETDTELINRDADRGLATVSAPAGARLEMVPGGLRVQKGRLVLAGAGATAPVDVGEGRALVRRKEPRPGERHPLLRFYESGTIP